MGDEPEPGDPGEPVEEWIVATQNTMGRLIGHPRMLPERLRKPPFRFLFDIATEVARTTGFGLAELFGGDAAAKPVVPGTREEKVAFLQRWADLVAARLGDQAPALAHVSAQNIVCGAYPEWTNYLLQCAAAAAWPTHAVAAQPESHPAAATAAAPEPAPAAPVAAAAHAPAAPLPSEPPAAAAGAAPAPLACPAAALGLEPVVPLAEAGPIAEMDFAAALQGFELAQQEFQRTAGAWRLAPAGDAGAEPDVAPASPGMGIEPAAGLPSEAERPTTAAAQAPLRKAAEVSMKVSEEIQRAQEILDAMEEGLERDEQELQRRRDVKAQHRAALEAARINQEAEAIAKAEAALQEAAAREAEAAENVARRKAEKARRKAEKAEKAEREAKEAAKEAAKARAVYPVSKSSAAQGPRMVAALGEEEYAWDGEEEQEEVVGGATSASVEAAPVPLPQAAYVDPMAACFTDDILGDGPSKGLKSVAPAAGFDFAGAEAAFHASVGAAHGQAPPLFEQVKAELKESYVTYLTASMPDSLLKKYRPDELIGCLQFLLQELRKCLASHSLGDVSEEEPTTLAEDLRRAHPDGWVTQLQGAAPWTLRQSHKLPDLLDTLQGLAGICADRLTDELGPMSRWAPEDSPLRTIPESRAAPISPDGGQGPLENTWDREALSLAGVPAAAAAAAPAGGSQPWSAELTPAPWETTAAIVRPATGAAGLEASSRLAAPLPPPPSRAGLTSSAGPAPVFSAALGPALWEQEALGVPTTAGPATAAKGRVATSSRAATAARPPLSATAGLGFTSQPQALASR